MAAPNIVNVATITGITSAVSGIVTVGTGDGITTVASNAASSGKVLKINSLVATAIGATTGIDVFVFQEHGGRHNTAISTVSLATTMTVPILSSLAVIDKTNSIYLEENKQIGVRAQSNAGTLDIVCSYEDIS
jgi:hypothetical protein